MIVYKPIKNKEFKHPLNYPKFIKTKNVADHSNNTTTRVRR